MDILFFLLTILSLLALVIGLIKPSLFAKVLKARATRKGVGVTFSLAMLVSFILFVSVIEPIERQPVTESKRGQTTQQTAPTGRKAA